MEKTIERILCKSYYKRICPVCKKTIYKNQWITKVSESRGIQLRPIDRDDIGYIAHTAMRVIHRDCDPGTWSNYIAYCYNENIKYTPKYKCKYEELLD